MVAHFKNYIPINIIPNKLKKENIDLEIDEIVNDKDFEKSDTKMETFKSIGEIKYPQKIEDGGIIILDDLSEKN